MGQALFCKRATKSFTVTTPIQEVLITPSDKKFIVYDGIKSKYHWAIDEPYKRYYDEDGNVEKKGLITRAAYSATKNNNNLTLE